MICLEHQLIRNGHHCSLRLFSSFCALARALPPVVGAWFPVPSFAFSALASFARTVPIPVQFFNVFCELHSQLSLCLTGVALLIRLIFLGRAFGTLLIRWDSSLPSTFWVDGPNVTADLLSKSRKTLHRPVLFYSFKPFRILCFCS